MASLPWLPSKRPGVLGWRRLLTILAMMSFMPNREAGAAPRSDDNAVTITVNGDVSVVLVDPLGRRDEYRGGTVVSTFPGCWRSPEAGGGESVGEDEAESTTNIFDLDGSPPGRYRIYVTGRRLTEVFIVIERRLPGGRVCSSQDSLWVGKRGQRGWGVSWNRWSQTDSCWVTLNKLKGTLKRKASQGR